MKRALSAIAFLLLCFAAASGTAQSPSAGSLAPNLAAAVDAAIQAEMARQEVVGLALGIIQNGRVVYTKGYGLADREQGVRVTTETVFNWASNSKPLAAVLAMQLVEKGRLDLDADVRTYVPEFPDKGTTITTRHLLCHQSGIPHYRNGQVIPTTRSYQVPRPFEDPVLALDTFNRSPLLFKPGEKDSYSSYAYVLLSAVVQRAGKQPFSRQVQERIAAPLRMTTLQYDVEANGQPHWAVGYERADDDAPTVRTAEDAHYWKHGAGGFKSNVLDFARWAEGLLNHRLVGAETEKAMWTPQKLTSGEATTRGLGFTVEQQGGLKVSHNGGQSEVATRMVLYPQAKSGIVVMSNCRFATVGKFSTAAYAALNQGSDGTSD